jgi:hypothetical protein
MNVASQKFNEILDRLTSDEMLEGRGRGNEIGFYIFDYLPEDELKIREAIPFLVQHLPRRRPGLRVAHVNLFDLIIEHLEERKLLDKAIEQARKKGDGFLLKALANPLDRQKIARVNETVDGSVFERWRGPDLSSSQPRCMGEREGDRPR